MSDDYGAQPAEVSLRDYLDLLRRRKAIIIQTMLVVFVVGVVVTLMAKPVYRTTARILVEGKSLTLAQYDSSNPLSNVFMPDTGHDVATQIEVLQGDTLLDDAFRAARVPRGGVRVQVKQVGTTDVIEITAEAGKARWATDFAQQLIESYRKHVAGSRKDEVDKALAFAKERYAEENRKLQLAEDRLQEFRAQNRIASLAKQKEAAITEMTQVDADLRKVQGEVNGLEAELAELKAARAREPKTKTVVNVMSNTAAKQAIRDKIAALETDRQGLLILYKPAHVKVQEVDAQIKELRDQLAKTPDTVTMTNVIPNPSLDAYDTRIAETEANLAQKKAELARVAGNRPNVNMGLFGRLEVEEGRLTRDVEEKRATVAMLAKSVEDLGIRAQATHDPVQVIAPAGPAIQVAPQRGNNLLLAALLGLVLGFCFALLQEYLDDRINAPEDARRILQAPILSYVPLVEAEEHRLLTSHSGGGSLLESYRVMRTNVQFAAVDAPTNSILVTSTAPGEGKSVTAANLAVAMAMDGRAVILVDADLRRPTIHSKFGVDQRPGLTNVLVGHTALEDALRDTDVPGLRLLTAGPLPPNPAELLNSRAMAHVHEQLKAMADVVIFDSPPFLATADAQVLAAEADGVLYVVQFGEARKSAVRHAVELLQQARARVLGVVFNKIDLTSRRDDYYYGYYRYYNYYNTPQIGDGDGHAARKAREFEALIANGKSQHNGEGDAAPVSEEGAPQEEKS